MTDALRLLLADADEAASPALAWRALAEVPRGPVPVIEPAQLFAGTADPCDLRVQRWGVVVPASADAVRLAAVAPLIAARAEEQGTAAADVRVLRFAQGDEPRAWIKRNLPGADLRRPRYLLLLGDLELVAALGLDRGDTLLQVPCGVQ